jgi:hypothetical protein
VLLFAYPVLSVPLPSSSLLLGKRETSCERKAIKKGLGRYRGTFQVYLEGNGELRRGRQEKYD